MKPLLYILGFALLFSLAGWTWSERPRPLTLFAPTWTPSYGLYQQPHAVWLDRYDRVGANIPLLNRTLTAAAKARQIPELVIYAIPLRDLGQASEGGFARYEDYLEDNRLNAAQVAAFVRQTRIAPVIYLEPDSIPLAVQYRLDQQGSAASQQIYQQRIRVIQALRGMYQAAGARVYLEAGHSGWFDYSDAHVQRIAAALNEAGIAQADGLASNVSNRQPVWVKNPTQPSEFHYLSRLLPLLANAQLDVRVDTSRNGGITQARQYFLSPSGELVDNEQPHGRLVGHWQVDSSGEIQLVPFFGHSRSLLRLTSKEKYQYDSLKRLLIAPAWLDAVGDVQLGPAPTDHPPAQVARLIQHFRYIKPPDDCDGALNCPPGASKAKIVLETQQRQPASPSWPLPHWKTFEKPAASP